MLAQSLYSDKELHGKNGNEKQEMCFQKGHNYNDLHWSKKRGSFITKRIAIDMETDFNSKTYWEIGEPPMAFKEEDFTNWL